MSTVKKTKRVFSAKKEVTEKDAKKLNNLLPWRLKENKRLMWSDNWPVFLFGVEFGVFLCAWVYVVARLLSV